MEVKNLVLDLTEFGRITGGGTWQWATGVAQDVHLTMAPKTLETVWAGIAKPEEAMQQIKDQWQRGLDAG